MKRTLLPLILCSFLTLAAVGQKSIGAGLAFGSEIETLGIGFNAEFDINKEIDISPSFIYYFKNNNVSVWELNGNVNYIFNAEGPIFYGIAGLNITGVKQNRDFPFNDRSDTDLGLNLGVGASFSQVGSVIPFAEIKYVLSNYDQLSIFGGVRVPF